MRRLPNKIISTKSLKILVNENTINRGGEGLILKHNNPHSVYKVFFGMDDYRKYELPENKEQKIVFFHDQDIAGTVKPIATLENNGHLIGYEMAYDEDDICFRDGFYSPLEKEEILRQSKELLEYFASLGITYGDVTADNILVNRRTGKVKFCDIDNVMTPNNPIDIFSYVLSDYMNLVGSVDEKADAYMHNLMTIDQLYISGYYEDLVELIRYDIMPESLEGHAKEIVKTMQYPPVFNGEYIIDHIK